MLSMLRVMVRAHLLTATPLPQEADAVSVMQSACQSDVEVPFAAASTQLSMKRYSFRQASSQGSRQKEEDCEWYFGQHQLESCLAVVHPSLASMELPAKRREEVPDELQ